MFRPDLDKDCAILQIILKVWQFSSSYKITFPWSLNIDLKVKSLSCLVENNSDLYFVQILFLKPRIQGCVAVWVFFQLAILMDSGLFSEQCHFSCPTLNFFAVFLLWNVNLLDQHLINAVSGGHRDSAEVTIYPSTCNVYILGQILADVKWPSSDSTSWGSVPSH